MTSGRHAIPHAVVTLARVKTSRSDSATRATPERPSLGFEAPSAQPASWPRRSHGYSWAKRTSVQARAASPLRGPLSSTARYLLCSLLVGPRAQARYPHSVVLRSPQARLQKSSLPSLSRTCQSLLQI
jgi:hypothetical protein